MKQVYLIRHAESFANAGGKSLPDREIPLTEKGKLQAHSLIRHLPRSSLVFTSEFLRTQQTAAPYLARYDLSARALTCLNEFSYLPFEMISGLSATERRPLSQKFWSMADPQWRLSETTDSFSLFNQRIEDFLVFTKTVEHQTICFTHGIWLSLLIWRLLGFSANSAKDMFQFYTWQKALPMENTAIWLLSIGKFMKIERQG